MYQKPVQPEQALRDNAVAEPLGTEFGDEDAGLRQREINLYTSQAQARALFAPFFAITNGASALLVGWAMAGHISLILVSCWVAAVGITHWAAYSSAMDNAITASYQRPRTWLPVAESVGLAVLWASLPVYGFITQAPETQMVIGGAMGAMFIAATALIAIPAAATAWIVTLTIALCIAFLVGRPPFHAALLFTFAGIAAAAAYSIIRLAKWAYNQLLLTAKARTEAESVKLLLREYEHHGVGWLWQVDSENRIVYMSGRMMTSLDKSHNQLHGHSFPAALGGSGQLGRALLARQPFANLEMEIRTRQGSRWIALAGDPIIDLASQFQGFRGVGVDITEVKKTQERLTNLAHMDVLSGLPNRGRVRQLLGNALSGAQLEGSAPCAIMFLDLDSFKPVNDTFGHPKGDAILKGVAHRLVKEVGDLGHVGRMGGDEFAVVVRDVRNRKTVEDLASRIIAAVAEPFLLEKQEIRIGVSIGCAFGPSDGQSVDDLIQKADLALYHAKAKGRGTCCYFDAEMQNEAEDRQRLERDMRIGIRDEQFNLVYQPLVDAATQTLVGFEALVRWNHPIRGTVSPLDFISLAEETGLIIPIGDWVIQEACRTLSLWPDGVTVAVNISPRQLMAPSLPNTVKEALSRYKIPADRFELEVTETVFMDETSVAVEVLKRLRELGLGIALDDFGTGYSSLGYLNKAVFHKLKIDGSFVREAAHSQETVAIIKSIVALAKSFRMTVTAEGVETTEDFTRMRDLGCHHIQGYLFGRPMHFDEATDLVRRGKTQLSA